MCWFFKKCVSRNKKTIYNMFSLLLNVCSFKYFESWDLRL